MEWVVVIVIWTMAAGAWWNLIAAYHRAKGPRE